MRIYLSFPLQHKELSFEIEDILISEGYEVLNPMRTYFWSEEKGANPLNSAQLCYDMIDQADCLVLHLDYGRDCAAEAGYAFGRRIPVFPISIETTPALEKHLKTWMISARSQQPSFSISELLQQLISYKQREK